MENPDKSPKELVEDLYTLFASFKKRMEDPNYIQIENSIQTMVKNQEELKTEVKELKRQLLNPFDGVIVETKKNTEARQDAEAKKNEDFKVLEEHRSLMRWKATMTKVAIGFLTSAGAVLTWILSKYFA
tara:strand:- start:5905 stop:6291 length:387 start_codon:yes stop_codon:yes gene_type:complete